MKLRIHLSPAGYINHDTFYEIACQLPQLPVADIPEALLTILSLRHAPGVLPVVTESLEARRAAIIADLREAYTAYSKLTISDLIKE